MEADLAHAQEALEAWQVLEKAFEEGKPGLENSYNQFTLHDEYLALLKNCDKYWTEFYPQVNSLAFVFKKGDVDFKTRTGTYEVKIKLNGHTQKFRELMNPIEKGLQKAWVEQWKDIPKNYPAKSLTYTEEDTYSKTGIATYKGIEKIENDSNWNSKTKSYEHSLNVKYRDSYEAAWIAGEGSYDYECRNYNYNLADIEFNVCDKNGKVLFAYSNRVLLGSYYLKNFYLGGGPGYNVDWDEEFHAVTLKNVNASTMELIDSQKVGVKITNMYLYYGKPSYADAAASAVYTEKNWDNETITRYSNYPHSRKFVDHLAALSYKNPKIISFVDYSENLKYENYYDKIESDFLCYSDYGERGNIVIDIENKLKFAMLKAEDEKYTPLELEGFGFIRGDYTVMRNHPDYRDDGYYYDYYCDINGNYKRNEKVKFIPSFYVDKESFNFNRYNDKHRDWDKLNEDADLPKGILRQITKDEFEVLKAVHPELKNKRYYDDDYDDYLIVRSASTVTKEFLEAQKNAPKLEKKNKEIVYFTDLEKEVSFTVKGKNLTKENLYACFIGGKVSMLTTPSSDEKKEPADYFKIGQSAVPFYNDYTFSGYEEKFYPASINKEKTVATFTVPVEKIQEYLYFFLDGKKKSFCYSFSGKRLNPVISQSSFDLKDAPLNLTLTTDCEISNSVKFLLDGKEIAETNSGYDYSYGYYKSDYKTILKTEELIKKAGTYKLELFMGSNLVKSWDITVTDVVGEQFAKFRTGQETLELSGTLVYDLKNFSGYTNIEISKNNNLSDLLNAKKIKVIIGENSQELSFSYYRSDTVILALPKQKGEYKIFFEIDGFKVDSGKTVKIVSPVSEQLEKFRTGQETLEISGTFYYDDPKKSGGYSNLSISGNSSLKDLLEEKKVKVIIGENSQAFSVPLGQKEATLEFDFRQVAGIFSKSGVKVEILIEKDSYKLVVNSYAVAGVSLKIKVPSPKKNGVYDVYVVIDGKTAKVDGKLYVGN